MRRTVKRLRASLSLEQACVVVDEALRAAREHGLEPLAVVVLDGGGHDVTLKREDGSGIIRAQIARAKAYGALGMGLSSRGIGEHLAGREVFATSLTPISGGRLATAAGGVLICDDTGVVVGAVGISGDSSHNDELVAVRGVRAAGLTPEPASSAGA